MLIGGDFANLELLYDEKIQFFYGEEYVILGEDLSS
jgi:hypothetical protein